MPRPWPRSTTPRAGRSRSSSHPEPPTRGADRLVTPRAQESHPMTRVYDCDHPHDLPFAEIKRLVGGKAANLAVMAVDLGLPVPPAFTITTATCNEYLASGWPEGLDDELREHMARIEGLVGRRFGGPGDPLLVSVRSGAPVSMPGMMDTILNLGLTTATTAALAAASGSEAFAANCRARFVAMFRGIVGTDVVPEDPWAQLRAAIEAVFRSWNSDRARTYRAREGIADDLGTAVTIQAMVFGNRSVDSGTGVLFTRNPANGEPVVYGDVMFNAQGEDVVAGTHRTEPIAVLDERMPAVGRELRDYAERLERHHADLCDIAFTPDAAVAAAEAGRPVILVRAETSPEDVHGLARAEGILTSCGGLASHAAVVARGWGIPAVVGASAVRIVDDVVTIGARSFRAGDTIAIDGGTGEVFAGTIGGARVPVPQVATLRAWAAELGIPIGEADLEEPAAVGTTAAGSS